MDMTAFNGRMSRKVSTRICPIAECHIYGAYLPLADSPIIINLLTHHDNDLIHT